MYLQISNYLIWDIKQFYFIYFIVIFCCEGNKTDANCFGDPKNVLLESVTQNPKVDIIFLIDRSGSIGESKVDRARVLVKRLLQYVYVVHPDFARVSVVTHAKSVKVTEDHISKNVTSCDLLFYNQLERFISFDANDSRTEYLPNGFQTVQRLFRRSGLNQKKVGVHANISFRIFLFYVFYFMF